MENVKLNNISVLEKRWNKFKTLKRGYYSLLVLTFLYIISFFLPLLINNRALVVKYDGKYFFPIFSGYISGERFNQDVPGEARYRMLKESFKIDESNEQWSINSSGFNLNLGYRF